MELNQLLRNHAVRQQKYTPFLHLSLVERQSLIRNLTKWIGEELTEVDRETQDGDETQRYKPFKSPVPIVRENLGEEISDIFIYWMGLVAVSGFSGPEMESIISKKLGYNNVRKDHNALGSINLEMAPIPFGTFMMGSPEGENDEKPQHKVTVQPFYMSKYLITQAQYQKIMGNNPSYFKGGDKPVERVSWEDAVEFCQKLSKQTGKKYRLPTEAEWEYACRAGTTTKYYFGDFILKEQVNYREAVGRTTPVGQYPPNAFGLYDMHGNVWEWCRDDWHSNYEGAPKDGTVWSSEASSSKKVIRGGSWGGYSYLCRSAYRNNYTRDDRDTFIGFRVVCNN